MRQRLIGLAGIDHSGNRAEFEAGRYGEQQFRTVLDIESHAIASLPDPFDGDKTFGDRHLNRMAIDAEGEGLGRRVEVAV